MRATLIDAQGVRTSLSGSDLADRLPAQGFFWLDLANASADEFAVLASVLHLDDTLSSWLPRFGRSAHLESSPQYLRISAWADAGAQGIVEGHILYSPNWLITAFDGDALGTEAAYQRFRELCDRIAADPGYALLIVLNELLTGFYPRLERADELLDRLEDQIFLDPVSEQLLSLADLRRELSSLHRLLVPLRDRVENVVTSIGGFPGISANVWPAFQTYSERLADLVELIDDYRQRTADAMEAHVANRANQQSEQINRLTVVSWVFLPISFLTGYFGMNFDWAVNHLLSTRDAFLLLGIGLPLASLLLTLLLFKSLGWLGAWRRKRKHAKRNRPDWVRRTRHHQHHRPGGAPTPTGQPANRP
ncbi:CorA family divalent cation transporter [Accumulibacter sp.]|uniref:magnesium transporter CorA family protein n=1 Tax=Accumulibacter sp. TaxID=2053492 RepID=UPI0025D6F476|nr:CorA family divalent cation transporter [Accumulibacter sp.]MCM8612017.1 hypothetical protein [Accumulibacter sp.]MCM8635986.1 hypothetical protein [Accumulibacter sp.]MCM8641861.1 hypothetical protein [Accumulibacter sp.]